MICQLGSANVAEKKNVVILEVFFSITNIDFYFRVKNITLKKIIEWNIANQGMIYDKLIRKGFIYSLSVLFRRSLFIEKIDFQFFIDSNLLTIDYAIELGIALHAKIAFIKDTVGVYRIRSGSISNNNSVEAKEAFYNTKRIIKKHYLTIQPVDGYSIHDMDDEINEFFFTKNLIKGDYESAKKYANLFPKKTILAKIRYLFSKTRFSVRLYSAMSGCLRSLKIIGSDFLCFD